MRLPLSARCQTVLDVKNQAGEAASVADGVHHKAVLAARFDIDLPIA